MRSHIATISIIIFLSIGIIITNAVSTENQESAEIRENNTKVYTLKDYNGQLALFINNNDIPAETYNIFTKSLPKTDAEALINGIIAKNEEELNKMLEEYLG